MVSLDEWRGKYKAYTLSATEAAKPNRDIREIWFAGVHSDAGGPFEPEPDLADISFQRIVAEAMGAGLRVDAQKFAPSNHLPTDHACGEVHQMGKLWVITGRSSRKITPNGAPIHESVAIRMRSAPERDKRYRRRDAALTVLEPWHRGADSSIDCA